MAAECVELAMVLSYLIGLRMAGFDWRALCGWEKVEGLLICPIYELIEIQSIFAFPAPRGSPEEVTQTALRVEDRRGLALDALSVDISSWWHFYCISGKLPSQKPNLHQQLTGVQLAAISHGGKSRLCQKVVFCMGWSTC